MLNSGWCPSAQPRNARHAAISLTVMRSGAPAFDGPGWFHPPGRIHWFHPPGRIRAPGRIRGRVNLLVQLVGELSEDVGDDVPEQLLVAVEVPVEGRRCHPHGARDSAQ
jgi:hypothetical protein